MTDSADPALAATKTTLRPRPAASRPLTEEAAFAQLCGTAPLPAGSGRTTRHRPNRGGDRHANYALHVIALTGWQPIHRPGPTPPDDEHRA